MPRTSATHPLRIDAVSCLPNAGGRVGLTFCPGKQGDSVYGDPWRRDLDADLDVIEEWGAQMAITLLESYEFALLGVPMLGEGFKQREIEWHHLPLRDLGAPDRIFENEWKEVVRAAIAILKDGGSVLVHCRGGLGRAGTVACMLLMELGANCSEALRKVRAARPGAVETPKQERYLATYSPLLHTDS